MFDAAPKNAVFDAAQETFGPFGQDTQLTHTQFVIDQNPQISFHGAALQFLVPFFVHTSRIAPSQVLNHFHYFLNCDVQKKSFQCDVLEVC